MPNFSLALLALVLIFIPLYPKFPLLGVSGTFVAVRLEDFLIAAILGWWLVGQVRQRLWLSWGPVHRAILLYLVIGGVAAFSGIFLTKTAPVTLGWLHALRRVEYMGLFFVAFWALRTSRQLHFLLRVILVTATVVALYGLGQQFLAWPVISTTNREFAKGLALTLGPEARINSTFAGHYDLAAYSIFPLLLVMALLSGRAGPKWPLWAIGALVYWALLLSASRITFAGFFTAAALFLWLARRRVWLLPLVALAVVSVLVSPQLQGRYREFIRNHLRWSLVDAVAAQPESKDVNTVPDALKPAVIPEDRSLNIRLRAEWPRAARALAKNPLLGTGFASVGLAVDNDYLRTLAETGIFGFAALVLILVRFFRSAAPFLARPPQSVGHSFIMAVGCSLVGLLVNAVFIDVFEASKVAIVTWTLLGLAEKVKQLV